MNKVQPFLWSPTQWPIMEEGAAEKHKEGLDTGKYSGSLIYRYSFRGS